MLQIPEHLMMSPPRALSDEEIGPALHESQGVVRSDLVRAAREMRMRAYAAFARLSDAVNDLRSCWRSTSCTST